MPLWSAFVFGLLGSLHCIGMCGPLVLALPPGSGSVWVNRIFYNFGRVITYAVLGGVSGWLGESLTPIQKGLMIVSGVVLLVFSAAPLLFSKLGTATLSARISGALSRAFKPFMARGDIVGFVAIGILNGALPCGFVYMALMGALAQETPANGALYMLAFGLGTFPLMYATSLAPGMITSALKKQLSRLLPFATGFLGILFILHGLALNIPYVSPSPQWTGSEVAGECHGSGTKGSDAKSEGVGEGEDDKVSSENATKEEASKEASSCGSCSKE